MRPIVGIISNFHVVNEEYPVHASGTMISEAISRVSDCVPLIIPADPTMLALNELLTTCDGFLLPGGRPNVHPEEYGERETEAHGLFDRDRDRLVLPLVRACIDRGQPLFGVCRGFQEIAVAMGSTLHPEIRDLPGRDNHRMPPDGTLAEKFALRHAVKFAEGGVFHGLLNAREVITNTLHGQGIKTAGARVVVDGRASDGTPEAIYIDGAPGFTISVQWHPEWQADEDKVSRRLFSAFGDAVRKWTFGQRRQAQNRREI